MSVLVKEMDRRVCVLNRVTFLGVVSSVEKRGNQRRGDPQEEQFKYHTKTSDAVEVHKNVHKEKLRRKCKGIFHGTT